MIRVTPASSKILKLENIFFSAQYPKFSFHGLQYRYFHLCDVKIPFAIQRSYVVQPGPSAGDTWSGVNSTHNLRPKPASDLPLSSGCRSPSTGGEKLWCVGFLID